MDITVIKDPAVPETVEDVIIWFGELVDRFGFCWHPEDLFNADNVPDANALDLKMEQATAICESAGVDICELAMEASRGYRAQFGLGVEEFQISE